jgi:6-phosphogluconolactonase
MGESYTAYVGTYTNGPGDAIGEDEATAEESIYRIRVDAESGAMETVGAIDAGENPSFLVIHPSKDYLYAVNEVDPGTVTACEVGEDGSLSRLNSVESGGAGPCHLSVEATGQYLLVADYASGLVSMLPIAEDGRVGEPSHVFEHEGSSVDPDRQTGPHVHSVTSGPDNQVAYVADLGTDELVVYDVDLEAGRLERDQVVRVRDGAGPRHVAVHPDGSTLYLLNELDSTVTTFDRDEDGRLEDVATVGTLPDSFGGENYTAEVLVHPSGEFLYASNRGHESVAVFELDGEGLPEPAGHVDTGGEWPRNFAIDPAGRFLFAENEHTDDVHAFGIDEGTGALDPTGEVIEIPQPVCMQFLA